MLNDIIMLSVLVLAPFFTGFYLGSLFQAKNQAERYVITEEEDEE